MASLVGIGDLHLLDENGKGGLAKYIENPDEYVMSEVDRVLSWARQRNIFNAVFYGDIGENPRMAYSAQIAFHDCLKRNPDIQFDCILGNHDKLSKDSAQGHGLDLIKRMRIPNLRLHEVDTIVKIGGQKVKMCPWPSTDFSTKMLNFGHVEVKGAKSDSGRVFDDEEICKSKALIAMGHLHTPHTVRNTYYCGTLYQTNFGEPQGKGFHHIEYNGMDDYEINQIPFDPVYKLWNCVVESMSDIEALPRGKHDLIKLVVKDGADIVIPDHPNIVITKVFKTKADLMNVLTEDLKHGSEMEIKTSKIWNSWLEQQAVPQRLKDRAKALRREILHGSK